MAIIYIVKDNAAQGTKLTINSHHSWQRAIIRYFQANALEDFVKTPLDGHRPAKGDENKRNWEMKRNRAFQALEINITPGIYILILAYGYEKNTNNPYNLFNTVKNYT